MRSYEWCGLRLLTISIFGTFWQPLPELSQSPVDVVRCEDLRVELLPTACCRLHRTAHHACVEKIQVPSEAPHDAREASSSPWAAAATHRAHQHYTLGPNSYIDRPISISAVGARHVSNCRNLKASTYARQGGGTSRARPTLGPNSKETS